MPRRADRIVSLLDTPVEDLQLLHVPADEAADALTLLALSDQLNDDYSKLLELRRASLLEEEVA